MRTSLRTNLMAAVAASLAQHSNAATIDLSWYAPNSTSINNLTQVMTGSGFYGWSYTNSQVPADEYGIYNWCNMPHVRKTEYKVPSSKYKLQYVEVVSYAMPIVWLREAYHFRSIDIISEQFTPPIPSLSNHIPGIVTTKSYYTTDNRSLGTSLHRYIGRDISHPRILSSHLDFLGLASFLR